MSERATTYELGSLDRALEILTVLAVHPGSRLADLSTRIGANGTTVLRALRVLERRGFVRRTSSGYHLGARLAELGQAAIESIDVVAELREPLEKLCAVQKATAHVGMFREGMLTVIGKIETAHAFVRYSTLGTRMPIHATAAGKAALAVLGDDYLARLTVDDLIPYTPNTLRDLELLKRDIEQTRERRFSIESVEYQAGFVCVGTAFRVDDELYSVSLSSPFIEQEQLMLRGEALVGRMDAILRSQFGVVAGI